MMGRTFLLGRGCPLGESTLTYPHDAESTAIVPMAVLCYSSGVMAPREFRGGQEISRRHANPMADSHEEIAGQNVNLSAERIPASYEALLREFNPHCLAWV